MANQSDRVMVRVRPETHAQLLELREMMAEAVRMGRAKAFWPKGPLTLCEVVAVLVDRELAHRRRSRLSAQKRRRAGNGSPGPELVDHDQVVAVDIDPLAVLDAGLKKLEAEIDELLK